MTGCRQGNVAPSCREHMPVFSGTKEKGWCLKGEGGTGVRTLSNNISFVSVGQKILGSRQGL